MFGKIDYAMVNVSQMGRSVAFYRDVLGIPLTFESPGWSEFDTGATTLALHPAPASTAAPCHGPTAGTCTLGFSVDDVDATVAMLQARGAIVAMPPTTQAGEGIRLAVLLDPDGMAISLAQPLPREG